MISIDVITCLPEILDGPLNESIVKRAQEKKLIEINIHNLRVIVLINIKKLMIIHLEVVVE